MGSSDQKNVFLAVILSGLVLFTWQSYFVPTPVVQDINKVEGNLPEKELKAVTTGEVANSDSAPTAIVKKTKETIKVENKLFTISNSGHSLSVTSDLVVKDFHKEDVKTSFLEVMGKENPVRIQVLTTAGFKNLNFNFIKTSEDRLEGSNALTAARATIVIGPKGVVSVSISSTNDLTYRFKFTSETKELENRKIRLYTVYNNSKLDTYNVGSEDTSDGNYDWVGLDFNYNIFALTFPKKLVGKVATNEKAEMNFDVVNSTKNLDFSMIFAEKNYDVLSKYGNKLEHSVDFGFFAILAVPILRGLQFFYDFFPNYGVSIILVTLLIRLITFPLQFKSFKSMKKMQKIQPELAALKEKFKDDPPRMQKETMALFKKAGANPLGGCLPMVLQMPVFFAFYQVLYNAYELVDAPFIGWIHDLSIKDPMYVLPVLMGAAMFAQTKLNPSTGADAAQQKMMMFMPLIFTFIMKDLPAGLNLYIFVSTLFGIGQQLLVYKMVD